MHIDGKMQTRDVTKQYRGLLPEQTLRAVCTQRVTKSGEQVGVIRGWGWGMGLIVKDGNVLYLDCSGGYMTVYISQVLDLYA